MNKWINTNTNFRDNYPPAGTMRSNRPAIGHEFYDPSNGRYERPINTRAPTNYTPQPPRTQRGGGGTTIVHDAGNVLGPLSGLLGSASVGAGMLGEAAVIGGVAAAPVLGAAAVATGIGYGTYKIGEALHLW